MLKRLFLVPFLLLCVCNLYAQKTITIKGKVQFHDNRYTRGNVKVDTTFVMSVTERDGQIVKTIVSQEVRPDGTYEMKMPITTPGAYTLQCSFWQSVRFWAEDEDIEVDFRGRDTARMIMKTASYIPIKGGRNNDLMNHVSFDYYRLYQMMIASSQTD